MAKKDSIKPKTLKNEGKISLEPETKVSKKVKTAPKMTKAKPTAVKATVAPVTQNPVVKAKGEKGGEKKAFISEPHQAPPSLEKRNFMLLNANGEDIGKFTGKSPRQAALKIANSGVTDITIRETGQRRTRNTREGKVVEYKVHRFEGSRIQRAKTEKDPAWIGDLINIPKVYKIGSEWVEVKKDDT